MAATPIQVRLVAYVKKLAKTTWLSPVNLDPTRPDSTRLASSSTARSFGPASGILQVAMGTAMDQASSV